ncbi:5-histidylcysteine sulfoxide synthase [Cognatazoarcus halotolerans]|uniref:5-histidylcysteine sulfoxide synthase n=1 Tax=Cognatazoarcus halotolerans TaxID=2686016 RepID=UPI001F1ACD8D|nr:5-histidylcysteine sulfoxide synthase [Cognatazoarcus halotolerans]
MLFPRTPLLAGPDPEAKREEIRTCFHATFDRYESLFGALASDEAYYRKAISLRHPLIFYLGHTATFFINKFILAGLIDSRIDPKLESMFAVGVDEMSWDDLDEANYDWPPVEAVWAYRRKVRAVVDRVIREAPLSLPVGWNDPFWAVMMGIEHERIHLETSSVLIRQHPLRLVRPQSDWQPCRQTGPVPANELVRIPAGKVSLGRQLDDPIYGWDNEYGRHEAQVAEFQAARYLTTNGEFLAFVEGGGYADDSVWEEEGLGWRKFARAEHPTFWVPDGSGWKLRLMTEEVAMPWDWPVETNYHEAKAFCNWKARETGQALRLPTEDEWNRLYDHAGLADVPADAPADANLHLDHWASSCPVTHFAHGELHDVVGNVWQWCETPTYPFEGFQVHPLYDDFTTPTFDDRHNMIKGGAWVSAGNESRHVSRYAFRRHFFQHAGFRYVVADAPVGYVSSNYESDALLSQYAEFHYGETYFGVPNFPQAVARHAIEAFGRHARTAPGCALDLGCATGRASFELARLFDRVTGVDFSARFINAGVKLASQGMLRYTLQDEGELVFYRECSLAGLGLDQVADKVDFSQGDACNLKPVFSNYDLIVAANLIDRLYSPGKFLGSVHERLNPGGLLVLCSPYTWLEEHTRRDEWIGGFKKDGERYTTLDGLKDLLGVRFELVDGPLELPFVIRETRRKFQHTLSEMTVWRLRGE